MKHYDFSRVIAGILVLALAVGLVPVTALAAEEEPETTAEEVFVGESDPMLGVQSGVEDVSARAPRSREELLSLDGVKVDENGEVISVDMDKTGKLSGDEMELLFSGAQSASLFSAAEDENWELCEEFGLTDEEIALGAKLHGSMLVFTSQLADLVRNANELGLSDEQIEVQAVLIASGYSNMQAQRAVLAQDILGLSLEQVKTARIAEAEASLDDTMEQGTWDDEANNLSSKLGLPPALVSEVLETTDMSNYEIEQAMIAALDELYASDDDVTRLDEVYTIDDDVEMFASSRAATEGVMPPQEVLGRPYSYDQQGNFDININTGAYSYTETDLSIPGKNGLDLVLTRQYHSDQANTMQPMGYYDTTSGTALTVFYRWFRVNGLDQYGNWVFRTEIVNPGQFHVLDKNMEQLAYETKTFSLAQYECAVEYMESIKTNVVFEVESSRATYSVILVPDIKGAGSTFNSYVRNEQDTYNYYVDEFALGHGWRFGLSQMRWIYPDYDDQDISQQKELILADGTRYSLDKVIGNSGNAIQYYVDKDYEDMWFRLAEAGEYTGAVYSLHYKDGKVEYFDSKGRNIAIRDRFNNTITIDYETEGSSGEQVKKITITDTLNNKIVYSQVYLMPGILHEIGTKEARYNQYWTLSLNGTTIRKYYSYEEEESLGWQTSASGNRTHEVIAKPRKLVAVANENGELTEYTSDFTPTRFNCFVQPASHTSKTTTSPVADNDGYDMLVLLRGITYPNGGTSTVQLEKNAVKTVGMNGYVHYGCCKSVSKLNSIDPARSWTNTTYAYGDFDNLAGWKALDEQTYRTTVQNQQCYPNLDDDGNITKGLITWNNYDHVYHFKEDDKNSKIEKYSYEAMPGHQNGLAPNVDKPVQNKTSWLSQEIFYDYHNARYKWPTTVRTVYYDPAPSNVGLLVVEQYTYDAAGDLQKYVRPDGQIETYRYDQTYHIPIEVVRKQDANTTLVTTNSLSDDKKSVLITETTSNDVMVGKSVYSYDSCGQLIAQDDYKDAENYVTTSYTYDYSTSALPVQVSVSGVKTANGYLAAGTPGFAAGTIVRRQSYNKRGWLTSQTDANGKTTTYTYDPVGRVTMVTSPDGTTQSYSYDVTYSTVTYTDDEDNEWLCKYGQSGKLLSVQDMLSQRVLEKRAYDQNDNLVKHVVCGESTPSQTTYYRYDTDGRLIEQECVAQERAGYANEILYHELYQYQDGSGKITKTVVGDTNAPSIVTTSYCDNMGNTVKTGIFRNGREELTAYAYDYLGNQTQVLTAYSRSKNCAYTTSSTYNHAGQVLSAADAEGNTVTYTYDWLGNRLTQRSPKDQNPKQSVTKYPTVYTYDALNRLVRVETPLAAGHSGRVDYTYDANGNVLQERTLTGPKNSPNARNTYYTYDSMNRVTQVKGDAKEEGQSGTNEYQYTNYTYDVRGNIELVTMGGESNRQCVQYTYDRYSRLLFQRDSKGQTQRFTYDINGNLTKKVDRKGVATNYTYDAMGRLTRSQAGNDVMSFTYTSTGQRGSATYNGQTTTYTYNSAGDLIKEVTPAATKTMTYGVGGLRESFTVVANGKTYLNNQYSYNKLGYLTKVNSGNVEGHYSYDSNGNVTNVTYGNNSTASYTYNKADMVTEVKNKYNKTELSNFKYTYGSDGNVLARTEGWGRNATVNYTYDGLNRLTQESQTGTYTFANTYAYDDYGNRQSVTDNSGVSTNYTYDDNNRLLSTTGGEVGTYTYDANGNLTQVIVGTGAAARTLSYTYDNFNRLKRVSDNTAETVYTYDANGLRLSKTSNGTTEQYVYDGDQLVLKLSVKPYSILSKTLTSTSLRWDVGYSPLTLGKLYYVEVNGVVYTDRATKEGEARPFAFIYDDEDEGVPEIPPGSELWPTVLSAGEVSIRITPYSSAENHHYVELSGPAGAQVAVYETDPRKATTAYIRGLGLIASRTNGAATYYHYDAHGNVVQLTGAIGTVLKDYTYDAFGVEQGADDTDANIFRYCGEQYDTETGNYYLRARYYTPGAGRFTQEDPAMDGLNWYAYCAGNPVGYSDPSGRIAVAAVVETLPAAGSLLQEAWGWLAAIGTFTAGAAVGAYVDAVSSPTVIPTTSPATVDGISGAAPYQATDKRKPSSEGKTSSGTSSSDAKNPENADVDDDDVDVTQVDPEHLPEGWTKTENNGFVHIRDKAGRIRIRIDPPTSKVGYDHKHIYSPTGQALDKNGNPVSRTSPESHIPYP